MVEDEEMMRPKKDRIYISGPMSAATKEEFRENVQRFHDCALLLERSGCRVVNPARAWPCRFGWLYRAMERVMGKELAYRAVLVYDLWLLARCQTLCLIDGWRDSRGAKIEEHFAYRLGIVKTHEYHPDTKTLTRIALQKKRKRQQKPLRITGTLCASRGQAPDSSLRSESGSQSP